jgi:ABC-type branched-subunit amino acid transport system ATPase component
MPSHIFLQDPKRASNGREMIVETHHLFPNITLNDNLVLPLGVLAHARSRRETLSEKLGRLLQVYTESFQVMDTRQGLSLCPGFSFDGDLGSLL